MADEEQNKSEEATPFKLARAREKGSVARGLDLGFFATLAAFLLFLTIAGSATAARLSAMMRSNFSDIAQASDPASAAALVGQDAWLALSILVLFGLTLLVITIPVEIFQLRGLIFSAQPLKPDFSRLNPAKGFKRLFSVRTLKEALKSVFKLAVYIGITVLAVNIAIGEGTLDLSGARDFGGLLQSASMRLVALFAAAALIIAVIDQIIVRREFAKQMRMSRSELTREHKEREGEPRIKAKRKQLHGEFIKQTQGIGQLAGSDMLIVNPEHFAVALAYDPASMSAPTVRGKARNRLALEMRRQAIRLNIPVIADPPLARALFKSRKAGEQIGPDHYRDVARHYSELRARKNEDQIRP